MKTRSQERLQENFSEFIWLLIIILRMKWTIIHRHLSCIQSIDIIIHIQLLQWESILNSSVYISSISCSLSEWLSHHRIRRLFIIRLNISISGIQEEAQQINEWSYNRLHKHQTRYYKNKNQIIIRKTHSNSQHRRKYSHTRYIISQSPS